MGWSVQPVAKSSPAVDALNVRYVVSNADIEVPNAQRVLEADGCVVYQRAAAALNRAHASGRDFYPGWHVEDGRPVDQQIYEPQTFRCGAFISLCAIALLALLLALLSSAVIAATIRDCSVIRCCRRSKSETLISGNEADG